MNRKSLIFASVLALLLLGGIIYMFYALFMEDDLAGDGEYVSLSEGINAVPSDAIFVLEAENLDAVYSMQDDGSALKRFIECIPDYSLKSEAVLSLHYSNKNTVSPLVVVGIKDGDALSSIVPDILSECRGVIDKRYDSFIIHKASVPDVSFTLYDRFLIASPSIVIVESALRHISSGSSVADVIPSGLSGISGKDAILQINFDNLGKFFSGTVSQQGMRFASFFQNLAYWGVMGIDSGESPAIVLDGRMYTGKGGDKFCEVLLSQRGRVSDIYSVVPHNTSFVLTLPLNSLDAYLSSYSAYLAANGKKKDYDFILATTSPVNGKTPASLAKDMEIGGLSVFTVNYGEEKKVLAIKAGKPSVLNASGDTVTAYPYKGFITSLFGKAFAPDAEEMCFAAGDWIVIGGEDEILSLYRNYTGGAFFSFEEYLSQTPASEETKNMTSLSLILNAEKYRNAMASFFKLPYSIRIKDSFGQKNFELLVLNTRKTGKELGLHAAVYSEDMSALPVPGKVAATTAAGIDETVVEIPSGPFEVIDFRDGSRNYLEQLPNNNIRLLNSARRSVWTIPFSTRICGTVRQIDYLKNDKLQMLFGSGNRVYLYDRLGRSVGKFPISLGKDILLGPDVYDFKGDKNYTLLVLHTDNTLAQYNIDGTKVSSWTEIRLAEKIIALPERIEAGGMTYWAVRTSFQTLIYDSAGIPVADFSKKWRLAKDSPVEVVSASEIAVTTADGKAATINLKNRTLKRR